MKMRTCAVAGMFYPRDPSHLEQLLEKFFSAAQTGGNSAGHRITPCRVYLFRAGRSTVHFPRSAPDFSGTFVIIGPSHRGYINCVSQVPWETPLGVVDN